MKIKKVMIRSNYINISFMPKLKQYSSEVAIKFVLIVIIFVLMAIIFGDFELLLISSISVNQMSHAMTKCIFGSLRPGQTQTGLRSHRD